MQFVSGISPWRIFTLLCTFSLLTFVALGQTTLDSFTLPEGFTIERVTGPELTSYPMFMAFDDAGRLFIAESTGKDISGKAMAAEPECQILRLEDVDGDGVYDTRTVFATELSLPMGVLWHQGSLFVASPPDFIRFDDTDGDGAADHREVLLTGWNVLNTASLHGPFLGPDGRLYLTHGRHGYDITTKEGERLQGLAARIWRCWPDGSGLERFAGGGFDNPVELAFLPSGEMLGTMTYFRDPKFGERDALLHYVWGGAYPKPHAAIEEFVRTGPDLMPVMSKFSRIAPSGLARYEGAGLGEDYDGVLLSAQFNPHRVQAHRVIREGATFHTEDRDFLTSNSPDFYPTDVVQDADGSLLVSDTGAWYVDACPVSRIAKPEVKGAIYRVRKVDGVPAVIASEVDFPPLTDPWGTGIEWDALSVEELADFLSDPRWRVRERAVPQMIARGSDSVSELGDVLTTGDTKSKVLALTALRQIDSTQRVPLLRDALSDSSMDVRLAAIQALGDYPRNYTISQLVNILKNGAPPEQRAAATTLGKIGEPAVVTSLLEACAAPADRFVEHALIYALIELEDRDALFDVVNAGWKNGTNPENSVKAALIALDQLGDKRLAASHVIPFLNSDSSSELVPVGLWVSSRHPEFATEVLAHLEELIDDPLYEPSDNHLQVLLSYARLEECQNFVGDFLNDTRFESHGTSEAFLLSAIAGSELAELPESWVRGIDRCLKASFEEVRWSEDENIRWRALELIRSRGISALDESLLDIVRNEDEEPALRLAALGAVAPRMDELSGTELKYVLENLEHQDDPSLRQAAARILEDANLSDDDKVALAGTFLGEADALVLTSLLQVFEGESDPELGDVLVSGLESNSGFADYVNEGQLDAVLAGFPESLQNNAASLKARLTQRDASLVERFLELEPRLGAGDVGRGRRIFFGETAACSTCHAIGEKGGELGPDLTTIGEVRTGHDLLEAVMFPNSSYVPDFTTYQVETAEDVFAGVIGRESSEGITLNTAVNEERYIPRSDIVTMTASPISLMPEGLDSGLSNQEVVDLITFLQTLDGNNFLEPVQH
jgi:putative membrane-bound dehydrogenase-like protein